MKKAPSYKGGGNLIKGEPDKPKKTTIDRTKYKAILDKPIEGTGTNVVGEGQDNFNPDVLKNMGYNYYSGTMGGKDIVYEKNGRYHIYNEQPNAKQNKYGLIDIGDLSEPTVNPAPIMAPNVVAPLVKPTIDPTRKSLDLSNPNMVLDPNTGTYTNPITGKRIEPIVEQYKHGGKVKGKEVSYNPELSKNDIEFQNWYSKNTLEGQNNIPFSDDLDYDYYSFFKNKGSGDIKNHFPDTYKRPTHKTFSDESIYSVPENKGGKWSNDIFIKSKANGGKVKGYAFGTTDDGVVPQYNLMNQSQGPMIQTSGTAPATSSYQSAIMSAQQKNADKQDKAARNAKIKQGADTAGRALGAYGTGYYASTPQENQSEDIRAKGMAAVGQTGAIGGAISGLAAIGDQIGEPIKTRSERLDESGNLVDPNAAKRNAFIGGMLSPSKAFSTRREMSKAGFKGNKVFGFGKEYTDFLEKQGKDKIQAERDAEAKAILEQSTAINQGRVAEAMAARNAGDVDYNVSAYNGPIAKTYDSLEDQNPRTMNRMREMIQKSGATGTGNGGGFGKNLLGSFKSAGRKLFADGGEIKGKGGPKSDSINAKVEEGSFIVPAENADLAKQLAIKILGKNPSKKANLSQGGETPVKLSDGEYMFSPEEKMELEANGIDLSTLAPNAKEDLINHLKCGGKVKGYAAGGNVDPKKELARINALSAKEAADRNALAKAKSNLPKSNKQKLSRAEDVRRAKAEHDRLSSGIDMLNKEYEKLDAAEKNKSKRLIGQSEERIRAEKIKLLNQIDKLQQDRDAVKATYDTAPVVKKSTTTVTDPAAVGLNYLKGDKTTTQETITPPLTTDKITETVTTKKAPSAKSKGSSTKEVMTADVLPTTSINQIPTDSEPGLYGERTAEEKLRMAQANQDAQVSSPSSTGNATSTAGGGTPSPASGERKGINWEGIGSNAINYGIPIIQTAIGLKKLKELGKRPVDSLDPQYLQAIAKTSGDVQTARENAKFGYTGEEMSAINQENAGLTNAGRAFARNIAGGSSAAGLNAERSVLNDAFGRKLQSKISDNALKMQKQEQAMARQQDLNSMLAHKQELNRRLFSDTLGAWNADQAGAGQLINAGLSNAMDAMKYNNFKKQYEQAQTKYQF